MEGGDDQLENSAALLKSLYLLNNKVAVEAFTSRLIDTYSNMGIQNAPGVMRLYPMGGEVKAGLKKATSNEEQDTDEFDRHAAQAGRVLADASVAYRNVKRRNVNSSLYSLAVQLLKQHPQNYPGLEESVQKVVAGELVYDNEKPEAIHEGESQGCLRRFPQDVQRHCRHHACCCF